MIIDKQLWGYKMWTDPEVVKEGEEYHEMFVVVEPNGTTLKYWRCHNNGKDHER